MIESWTKYQSSCDDCVRLPLAMIGLLMVATYLGKLADDAQTARRESNPLLRLCGCLPEDALIGIIALGLIATTLLTSCKSTAPASGPDAGGTTPARSGFASWLSTA
jgi:hypothetical protein